MEEIDPHQARALLRAIAHDLHGLRARIASLRARLPLPPESESDAGAGLPLGPISLLAGALDIVLLDYIDPATALLDSETSAPEGNGHPPAPSA